MKYTAKIVEIEPGDPGYYYATYEYRTESGRIARIKDDNAITIGPWDLTKEHKINIDQNGEISHTNAKGLLVAIGIVVAMILVAILSGSNPWMFGLFFLAAGLFPVYLLAKNITIRNRRKKAMRANAPIDSEIIWYKEVIRKNKNSRRYEYYPVVEFMFQGHKLSAKLPTSENPVHKGEHREVYIDMQHQDVFTKDVIEEPLFLPMLFTLLFTCPFALMGAFIMLPEGIFGDIAIWFIELLNNRSTQPNQLNINELLPIIMIGAMLLAVVIPTFKEIIKWLRMRHAQTHGEMIYATLKDKNEYGVRTTHVYQYNYRGQVLEYQSQHTDTETAELYIHPKTHAAYTKRDIYIQGGKCIVMVVIIVFVAVSFIPFLI